MRIFKKQQLNCLSIVSNLYYCNNNIKNNIEHFRVNMSIMHVFIYNLYFIGTQGNIIKLLNMTPQVSSNNVMVRSTIIKILGIVQTIERR